MTDLPAPVEVTFHIADVPMKALMTHVARVRPAASKLVNIAYWTVLFLAVFAVHDVARNPASAAWGNHAIGALIGAALTLAVLIIANGRRYTRQIAALTESPWRSGPLSVTLNAQGARLSRPGLIWAIDWPLVFEVDQFADTILIKASRHEFLAVPFSALPATMPPDALLETIAIWRTAAKAPQ